ncbi:MAG: hypothetical protein C5B50_05750 [Verrucomicrobia bacterium]|nr:MAG: hypothetical protein C5B50_05750 [Verrucomicrobiota bacterium]
MPQFVSQPDLHAGDVLLYHGDSFISKLIRLFDGTEYSHASIWTGTQVVEALGEGVVGRDLKPSVAGAKFVDVYRYVNKDTGQMLGDDGSPLPAKPVLAQADQFEKDHDRYAYEEILLLAVLASTRQVTAPIPFLGLIVRNILDHAADVVARLTSSGKEPLICSELVYRCYAQAGAGYQIRIRGADLAQAMAASLSTISPVASEGGADYGEAAAVFLENYEAAKRPSHLKALASAGVTSASGAPPLTAAVADFVTPGDLKKSPDLQMLGTLRV